MLAGLQVIFLFSLLSQMISFLSRNKGFLIGAGVAGIATGYAGYLLFKTMKEKLQPERLLAEVTKEMEKEQYRGVVYTQTQEQCAQLTMQFLPALKARLLSLLDINTLVSDLKQGGDMHLWEELKIVAFARVVVGACAMSILNIVVRLQVTILARNSFCENKKYNKNDIISNSVRERYLALGVETFINTKLPLLVKDIKAMLSKSLKDHVAHGNTTVYTAADIQHILHGIRDDIHEMRRNSKRGVSAYIVADDGIPGGTECKGDSAMIVSAMLDELWDVVER